MSALCSLEFSYVNHSVEGNQYLHQSVGLVFFSSKRLPEDDTPLPKYRAFHNVLSDYKHL